LFFNQVRTWVEEIGIHDPIPATLNVICDIALHFIDSVVKQAHKIARSEAGPQSAPVTIKPRHIRLLLRDHKDMFQQAGDLERRFLRNLEFRKKK
jgi:hypothetical protein